MKWLLIGLLILTGCNKDSFLQPKRNIEMTIDSRLPKDQNGYSVFSLYSTETQNIHTITGSIRVNGKIPNEPREKIEWESSHYWTINLVIQLELYIVGHGEGWVGKLWIVLR